MNTKTLPKGFTLVELLIVIVVISILVTIGTISYNAYIKRAEETSVKSALAAATQTMKSETFKNNSYPSSISSTNFKPSSNVEVTGGSSDGRTYCLIAKSLKNPSISYYATEVSDVTTGTACPSDITINPLVKSFGTGPINDGPNSTVSSFAIYNTSDSKSITITEFALIGDNTNFHINEPYNTGSCHPLPITLAPGQACTKPVRCKLVTVGEHEAKFRVTFSGGRGSPAEALVKATGTSP